MLKRCFTFGRCFRCVTRSFSCVMPHPAGAAPTAPAVPGRKTSPSSAHTPLPSKKRWDGVIHAQLVKPSGVRSNMNSPTILTVRAIWSAFCIEIAEEETAIIFGDAAGNEALRRVLPTIQKLPLSLVRTTGPVGKTSQVFPTTGFTSQPISLTSLAGRSHQKQMSSAWSAARSAEVRHRIVNAFIAGAKSGQP